jgi:5-methylcytosine-specific restriction enzyme subunit McrC
MPSYTLREWERLPHGDGEGCIPAPLAGRLISLAKTSRFAGRGGGGVLEDRRHEVKARGVVGVLAVEGGSLEILPKIDVASPSSIGKAKRFWKF